MKWQLHRHNQPDLSFEGEVTTEIDMLCDLKLQSGEIESVDRIGEDGSSSSQYLPSYCKGSWPQCLGCRCAEGKALWQIS